jgi:hypothetical protein
MSLLMGRSFKTVQELNRFRKEVGGYKNDSVPA